LVRPGLLERKHKPQSFVNSAKDALRNTTRAFLQKLAVQRDDLRDVDYGPLCNNVGP